jgi:hypothetical protein
MRYYVTGLYGEEECVTRADYEIAKGQGQKVRSICDSFYRATYPDSYQPTPQPYYTYPSPYSHLRSTDGRREAQSDRGLRRSRSPPLAQEDRPRYVSQTPLRSRQTRGMSLSKYFSSYFTVR